MNDLRFVLRILRRSPGFFLVAMATLGLGIAANTAMFSLFYQVLLRSLPVPDPQQLVVVHSEGPVMPGSASADNSETVFSYPMYRRLRDGLHSFSGIAARTSTSVQVGIDGAADRGHAEVVSGNFFETLRVRPALGRLFASGDDTAPGANSVVVLSHDFWTRHFAGQSSVLNRTILLNGQAFTVVGVSAADFRGVLAGDAPDLFVPISAETRLRPGWNFYEKPDFQFLTILGRLAPNATRERASTELQPLFTQVLRDQVEQVGVKSATVKARILSRHAQLHPAAQGLNELERQWRSPLIVLLGMASLLLLIACANLANLLAARATNRSREIGVRLALGAPRSRIARLLVTESGVLALAGTVAGVALAPLLNRALLAFLPTDATSGWVSDRLNLPILAFSAGLMMAVAILCGLTPAVQAIRSGAVALGERGASGLRASAVTRKVLVAGQVALSLVLLVASGLFSRSLVNLMRHPVGFRSERVLTFSLDAGLAGYDVHRGLGFFRDLGQKLSAVPGVESVSLADHGPLSHSTSASNVQVEGYQAKEDEEMMSHVMAVGPGFFRTLGTPLISGREFDDRDSLEAPKVVVVNQAFVRRYFSGRSATGLHMNQGSRGDGKLLRTIVGVVTDVQNTSLREPAVPTYYVPYEQAYDKDDRRIRHVSFFVRASSGFGALPAAVRRLVAATDRTLPVFSVRTMDEQVQESIFSDRLIAALSTAFGVLAMALTAVGLYGVIAYLVTRRTTEIGVRMALGATRFDIVGMILAEVAMVVCVGGAVGLAGAYAAGRSLESQLFGLHGFDPVVFICAPLLLMMVALFAASMPALRASRVSPLQALRHE